MAGVVVCWNCQAPVWKDQAECPRCHAGLATVDTGNPLRVGMPRPPERLGASAIALLIVAGLVLALVLSVPVAAAIWGRSCLDCGGLVTTGTEPVVVALFLWPLLSLGLIVLASQRRKHDLTAWDADEEGDRIT